MPYTAAHGPPALDATHAWAPATGTAPPVLGTTGQEPRVLPGIEIENIANWRGLPELTDNRDARTTGIGEIAYPSRRLGKTLVYEARIVADDRLELLATQNAIVQGYSGQDAEGTMTVTPWPSPGGVAWTFKARVLALEFDDAWELFGDRFAAYEWPFTLTLRMSDPQFYTGGAGTL